MGVVRVDVTGADDGSGTGEVTLVASKARVTVTTPTRTAKL